MYDIMESIRQRLDTHKVSSEEIQILEIREFLDESRELLKSLSDTHISLASQFQKQLDVTCDHQARFLVADVNPMSPSQKGTYAAIEVPIDDRIFLTLLFGGLLAILLGKRVLMGVSRK
jgi:hypothetical protein